MCKKEKNQYGSVCYYNNKGQKHRLDGPAVEYSDGSCEWFMNGYWHRTDGPAINFPGQKEWYINGRLHRINGAAIEWISGSKEWYIKGYCYTKTKHNRLYLFSILEPQRINLNPMEE
jgi:hypothetical protein